MFQDKPVSKRQISRDVKRRSGENINAPLSDQQNNILIADNNLLNTSEMNMQNTTIDIPHRLFHQRYPSGDENPRVPIMSAAGGGVIPFVENGCRNGSNSLPRKLNHTSNPNAPSVVMNVYSDYVSHGQSQQTSLHHPPGVVTNGIGHGHIMGSASNCMTGVTSSTPRDANTYNPIYPSQMHHQSSTNPYLRNFQSYPAFQTFNGSSSNASDISTDTYANLPKSFSLFRSKNNFADSASAFNQSASNLPTSSTLRYSQSALSKSSCSGPSKQF